MALVESSNLFQIFPMNAGVSNIPALKDAKTCGWTMRLDFSMQHVRVPSLVLSTGARRKCLDSCSDRLEADVHSTVYLS